MGRDPTIQYYSMGNTACGNTVEWPGRGFNQAERLTHSVSQTTEVLAPHKAPHLYIYIYLSVFVLECVMLCSVILSESWRNKKNVKALQLAERCDEVKGELEDREWRTKSQSALRLTCSFQGAWTHQKFYCGGWLIESDNLPWTEIVIGFNVVGLAF